MFGGILLMISFIAIGLLLRWISLQEAEARSAEQTGLFAWKSTGASSNTRPNRMPQPEVYQRPSNRPAKQQPAPKPQRRRVPSSDEGRSEADLDLGRKYGIKAKPIGKRPAQGLGQRAKRR